MFHLCMLLQYVNMNVCRLVCFSTLDNTNASRRVALNAVGRIALPYSISVQHKYCSVYTSARTVMTGADTARHLLSSPILDLDT